jgi:tRNA(fMet)-specific endonuclease VapC
MYALDTNTVIYFFRGMGWVAARLLETPPAHVALPAIVVFELEAGMLKSRDAHRRRAQFDDLLDTVTVLPFDERAAKEAAQIRVELEAKGTPIGPFDVLIAGTARARDAVLVTHNTVEFSRVAGLRLEDWFGSP